MMSRLGDIFTISSGGTPDKKRSEYYNNGTIPWVKTGDLKGKYVPYNIELITQEALDNSSAKLFPPNTVLVAMYGATIGACSILDFEASTNQACAAFLPTPKVLPDYLYYFLNSKKSIFIQNGVGGAQPNISAGYLKKFPFDVKSLDEQKKIVLVLDKVNDLISLRKQQLAKLDELVKARFVEMFGDPILNPKRFQTIPGEKLFKLSNGKTVPEEKRKTSGIPAYGGNGISWYTDKALYENDTLVVGRVGFQSGNVHLAKGPLWITDNAMYISNFYTNDYNLIFLYSLMEHINFTRYQDAGDLRKITQKPFMQMYFIYPHAELQNQYSAFVAKTDKSKLAVQQSLDKLEVLKKSLMQEYFR